MKLPKIKNNYKINIEQLVNFSKTPISAMKLVLAFVACGKAQFVAPGAPGIFRAIQLFKQAEKYSNKQINNAYYSLKRKKLIKIIEEKNGSTRVELTVRGQKKIKDFELEKLIINTPKKWDKKWRVLIFDIPTNKTYNNARDALRFKIKQLGFHLLQRSVWIYPYPCEEEILFVAESYNVEKYIEILLVEKLLHENVVKEKFKNQIGK